MRRSGAYIARRAANPSFAEDGIVLFSHGTARSECLLKRLTEPSNRWPGLEYIAHVRWVLLLRQLPHLLNAEEVDGFDYHIEKCSMERHAKSGPPLSTPRRCIDLHGKHARSNCASTKAGVHFAHTGMKRGIGDTSALIGYSGCIGEPAQKALLGAFDDAQCGKFFPEKPAKARTELAYKLITRQLQIRCMPHGNEERPFRQRWTCR